MSETNNGTNTLIIIGYIYLFISQIMTLYFWWEYAHENSFWSSIVIGFFVGEFKGLFWIFFIW